MKGEKISENTLYSGIVRYINNFFSFFNQFSKKKTNLDVLVKTFLYINFLSGWFAIFFITRVLDQFSDSEVVDPIFTFYFAILFLIVLTFWVISLITSFKVKKEVSKWQNLFPKLEDWASELESLSIEDLNNKNSVS